VLQFIANLQAALIFWFFCIKTKGQEAVTALRSGYLIPIQVSICFFLYFLLVATKFSVHLLIAQLIFIGIREPSVFSIDETSIFNTLSLRQMTECEFSVIFSFIYSLHN